jgi:hypothetical protein
VKRLSSRKSSTAFDFVRESMLAITGKSPLLKRFVLVGTETLLCSRVSSCFMLVKSFRILPLGSVLCEQGDVTFEVTEASFMLATCQVYIEV